MSANMPDNAGPSMTAFVTANRPSLKPLFRALPIEHDSKSIVSETTEAVMITCNVNSLLDVELKWLWKLITESKAPMGAREPQESKRAKETTRRAQESPKRAPGEPKKALR